MFLGSEILKWYHSISNYIVFFKTVLMSIPKGGKNCIKIEQKAPYVLINKYNFNKYNLKNFSNISKNNETIPLNCKLSVSDSLSATYPSL